MNARSEEQLQVFPLAGLEDATSRPVAYPGHRVNAPRVDVPDGATVGGTSLWSEGNGGSNELHLQRTLALGSGGNLQLLKSLAGVEDDWNLDFVLREVGDGTGGAMDVVALFRRPSGQRLLVLVDCKNAEPATQASLDIQLVRAQLLTLPVLANLVLPTPLRLGAPGGQDELRLVVLAGLNPRVQLPASMPLREPPQFRTDDGVVKVPAPRVVAFLPLQLEGTTCFVHGPWPTVDKSAWTAPWVAAALRENRDARKKRSGQTRPEKDSDGVVWRPLMPDAPNVVVARAKAADYLQAMLPNRAPGGATPQSVSLIRSIRTRASRGDLPGGWQYLGETLDKGKSRLFFCLAGGQPATKEDRRRLEAHFHPAMSG